MLDIRYYINGVQVPAPENHKALELELNFDKDSPTSGLTLGRWHWVNENAEVIRTYVSNGIAGGAGILCGLPMDIVISDGSAVETFKNYLDLTDGAEFATNEVFCNSKEYASIASMNEIADGFSLEYLHNETSHLPSSLFISVPYILNNIPNYKDIFLVTFSMAFVANELAREVSFFIETIAAAANPFSSASEIIRIAVHIAYTIALLIALIRLIKDIIDLIIQPVKYHKGMYVSDMLDAGFAHMGYTFESTILKGAIFKDLLILPEKYENPPDGTDTRILGFKASSSDQKGYYNGTFGQLLRDMRTMFNGKFVVIGNTVKFERRDWVNNSAVYVIPDIRSDFHTYNTEEFNANHVIEFRTDVNDKNTIQEYLGTIYQTIIKPITNPDPKIRLMKGLKQISIPFALGKRKEELTKPESLLSGFLSTVSSVFNVLITVSNGVISAVNFYTETLQDLLDMLSWFGINIDLGIPAIDPIPPVSFDSVINDRIGMLLLENDAVMVPKALLVERGSTDRANKIVAEHKTYLSAKYLWNNFYYIDSFAPYTGNPKGNQWKIKEIKNVKFSLNDFLLVKNNSSIFDSNGNEAKIDSLKWNPWTQTADIKYRINEKYTSNITLTTHEGEGY